jgi:hypothetical protein
MPTTSQFVTAADFWSGMVEPDYQEHTNDIASLRAALHSDFFIPYVHMGARTG